MTDRDPRDRRKTLATLQPSFVMPELDITHSSWLGKSFPLIDILRHPATLWPPSGRSRSISGFIFKLETLFLLYSQKKNPWLSEALNIQVFVCVCQEALALLAFLPGAYTSLSFLKVKTHVLVLGGNRGCSPSSASALDLPAFASAEKYNHAAHKTNEISLRYANSNHIFLSLFLCRVLPAATGLGAHLGGGRGHSVACRASPTLALHTKRGVLIWCACKQHYRWKRFRRCLASINPICVLTHFKCACHCTHEMRETLRWSNGCNISKDFSGHTKEMSSLRDLHSVKRKAAELKTLAIERLIW